MHVIEHLNQATDTLFSFEIIPPPRGKTVRDIIDMVEQIQPVNPPFIDVTSHMAEATYEERPDGSIKRRVKKKRPGTISICGIIQNRYGIDTVPHLLCTGFTREESRARNCSSVVSGPTCPAEASIVSISTVSPGVTVKIGSMALSQPKWWWCLWIV